MVLEMLNRHPDILSMSEFFLVLSLNVFPGRKVPGGSVWRSFSELLYTYNDPDARFNALTLPSSPRNPRAAGKNGRPSPVWRGGPCHQRAWSLA